MAFNQPFNLFEFTEKVLDRFRKESGFELTGYEFEYKFSRDWNCPIPRINFDFFIFGEDYAHTCFDEQYATVDRVIEILFLHLRDDAGMDNLRDGLINAKRHDLESRLEKLTERIEALAKEKWEALGLPKIIVMVDEKYPYNQFYENGFPIYQYQVYSIGQQFERHFDLDYKLWEFDEKAVYAEVEKGLEEFIKANLSS